MNTDLRSVLGWRSNLTCMQLQDRNKILDQFELCSDRRGVFTCLLMRFHALDSSIAEEQLGCIVGTGGRESPRKAAMT